MNALDGKPLLYDPDTRTWSHPFDQFPPGPVMTTASGLVIDYLRPEDLEIRDEDVRDAATHICRYNGARQVQLIHHFALCTLLAQHEFAVPRTIGLIAQHDFPEAILGDVVSGLKKLLVDYRTLEPRWEARFWDHYGYIPPNAAEAALIRHIDLRALVVETHMTQHPVAGYTAYRHGGPPTRSEVRAWERMMTYDRDRCWELTLRAVREGATPSGASASP